MHERLHPAYNKEKPRTYIIHVDTSDFPTKKQPHVIVEDIVELTLKLRTNSWDVSVSNIVSRGGQYRKKESAVNYRLKHLSKEKILCYNDHRNIISTRHLNSSKLDLNIKGTKILFNNFVKAIFDILEWQPIIHNLSDSTCAHLWMRRIWKIFKEICSCNLTRTVIAHLKYECLEKQVWQSHRTIAANMFLWFRKQSLIVFIINVYSEPFRVDRNCQGGL